MAHTTSFLEQRVYIDPHNFIFVDDVHETLLPPVLPLFLKSAQYGTVGVAATYRTDCSLLCLAFATLTRALVVHFSKQPNEQPNQQQQQKKKTWKMEKKEEKKKKREGKKKKKQGQQQKPTIPPRTLLQDHILCDSNIQLYGYRMDRIAVAIFLELSLRINAAVDILSVSSGSRDRRSLQAI
ncbi:hypothetical protein K503DRAFT_180512, partial [Rhizopogon vinicolor AM-OR11-026]